MIHCKNAGLARQCKTCIHNPTNQRNQPRQHTIAPTVGKDGNCKMAVQQIKGASNGAD